MSVATGMLVLVLAALLLVMGTSSAPSNGRERMIFWRTHNTTHFISDSEEYGLKW